MRFRESGMEQVQVVRSFDEAGGRISPDHMSRAIGAPGSRVLFDTGGCCRRHPSSSVRRLAGQGASLDRLE